MSGSTDVIISRVIIKMFPAFPSLDLDMKSSTAMILRTVVVTQFHITNYSQSTQIGWSCGPLGWSISWNDRPWLLCFRFPSMWARCFSKVLHLKSCEHPRKLQPIKFLRCMNKSYHQIPMRKAANDTSIVAGGCDRQDGINVVAEDNEDLVVICS